MKAKLKFTLTVTAIIFGAGVGGIVFTGCEDKPRTLKEGVGDALDTRPNEKLKDAGEDIKDAVKDAKEEIKDDIKR